MQPDYKNWMPRGMIFSFAGGAAAALVLCLVAGRTGLLPEGTLKTVLVIALAVVCAVLCAVTIWSILMYRAFDYNGKRQMSRQIIQGVAAHARIPAGGKGLDVGCGSGALTIALAKNNPEAEILGVDRWGKEYASFSRELCRKNAAAEGVTNTSFEQGDATHLEFPDGTFDAVVSNYVYHNIPGNRQQYLLETLRTLKTGGVFAIHDIFSPSKYGDMQAFVQKLKDMGYEKVEWIDTTDGKFMSRWEAIWMGLSGSALLTGRK